jgi:transcriptional regulator with XRE-family HTH domain
VRQRDRVSAVDGDKQLDFSLGQALRAARQRSGLTMAALAQRAQISQPHLSQMENGKVSPSIGTLYRLATALEVSPQELLPAPRSTELVVVRAGEVDPTPIEDRPDAALARVLVGSPGRTLQVQEISVEVGQDAGGWFEHDGEEFLYVLEGALELHIRDHTPAHLRVGDVAWYPSRRPHRWVVNGAATRVLAVSALRPSTMSPHSSG